MTIDNLKNQIHLGDCLDFMRQMPDKCVDLVLTDPPYGIGYDRQAAKQSGTKHGKAAAAKKEYKGSGLDDQIPQNEVFSEIIRVSKNQIIFGGNYFSHILPPSSGWIFWDKETGSNQFSDGELAWSSFDIPLRKVTYTWNGMIQGDMKNKEKGMSIFDPFSGSGTTALACHDLGLDFICVEKDPDYHAASVKRLQEHQRQGKLF